MADLLDLALKIGGPGATLGEWFAKWKYGGTPLDDEAKEAYQLVIDNPLWFATGVLGVGTIIGGYHALKSGGAYLGPIFAEMLAENLTGTEVL